MSEKETEEFGQLKSGLVTKLAATIVDKIFAANDNLSGIVDAEFVKQQITKPSSEQTLTDTLTAAHAKHMAKEVTKVVTKGGTKTAVTQLAGAARTEGRESSA